MGMFKTFVVESSIEINAGPEKIWDFFYKIESNYKDWYPEEHHYFKWTKGKALEPGSKFDSLEIVDGHKTRIKGVCQEAVKNSRIGLKPSWPVSFMCPKLEWLIVPQNDKTTFTAKTYYKFGRLFLTLKKGAAQEIMNITQIHMNREGENLKRLLENIEPENLSKTS